MYIPEKYSKTDKTYIFNFIKENPFATFILQGKSLLATHIPVIVRGTAASFTLEAHIAKTNPQINYLVNGKEVLFIFKGADHYISSSWYTNKDISTWDYSAVHINAKLQLQTKSQLISSLKRLVRTFEKDLKHPEFYEDLPQNLIQQHLTKITGFTGIPVEVNAIAKLHQGFDPKDINSVVTHLKQYDCPMAIRLADKILKENLDKNF